ncbi:MAG: hypothetical protein KMY50_00500 [Candidatus Desulforudis sp.]|nr:hypothetical protein [Desulforudis sp.]
MMILLRMVAVIMIVLGILSGGTILATMDLDDYKISKSIYDQLFRDDMDTFLAISEKRTRTSSEFSEIFGAISLAKDRMETTRSIVAMQAITGIASIFSGLAFGLLFLGVDRILSILEQRQLCSRASASEI